MNSPTPPSASAASASPKDRHCLKSMEVIRLVAGDEAKVREAAPLFDDPPNDEAVRAFLADVRNYLLIAYVDGLPAGFARAHALQGLETPKPQMFLYEIGVAPAYRRRGAARALIESLGHIGRERGCWEMFVITNESNGPAMRLYETTGGRREAEDDVVFVYDYAARDSEPAPSAASTP